MSLTWVMSHQWDNWSLYWLLEMAFCLRDGILKLGDEVSESDVELSQA